MDRKDNTYILAKFDISGIQQYIFGTNRLQENVGASYQVTRILTKELPASIGKEVPVKQCCIIKWEEVSELGILKGENICAEIIYIGGGNAIVLFSNRELFSKVCQRLGEKVAKSYQGLYLAAASIETGLEDFRDDIRRLEKEMEGYKANMIRQPVYSPFPIVEQSNSDHQPITRCVCISQASDIFEEMTEIKYQKKMAYEHFMELKDHQLYPPITGGGYYEYPIEMNDLSRAPGENSYVAVVHIDGNGMGEQVKKLQQTESAYAKAVPELRKHSQAISRLFGDTYKKVLDTLVEKKELLSPYEDIEAQEMMLPLRPIVMDGDDLTFVCTADMALPIATGFLCELFREQKEGEERITACAGIAFVHNHFPFYEAYKIAEESCARAKEKWYKDKEKSDANQSISYLDFQVVKEGQVNESPLNQKLHMRPYAVIGENMEGRPDLLKGLVDTINEMTNQWPSNRLHKIYRAMLGGENQMEFLHAEFISRGYHIERLIKNKSWKDSPLFDALEIRGLCKMELLDAFLEKAGEGNQ